MIYQGFKVVPAQMSPNLYEIKFDGAGSLAAALVGLYTSKGLAVERIDAYLEGRLGKKVKNAQANTEG